MNATETEQPQPPPPAVICPVCRCATPMRMTAGFDKNGCLIVTMRFDAMCHNCGHRFSNDKAGRE